MGEAEKKQGWGRNGNVGALPPLPTPPPFHRTLRNTRDWERGAIHIDGLPRVCLPAIHTLPRDTGDAAIPRKGLYPILSGCQGIFAEGEGNSRFAIRLAI